MTNFKVRTGAVAGALLCLASASACSKNTAPAQSAQSPMDSTERVQNASGEMVKERETLTATVVSIDPSTRVVSLKDEQGKPFAIEAGAGVALDQLRPNDKVDVTYQESIAFALQDPSTPPTRGEQAVREDESQRQTADGVQFGRQISTTVEIVAVAPEGKSATFRVPNGQVRTVSIGDETTQGKIATLRPGDSVAVTYTEQLALNVPTQNQ